MGEHPQCRFQHKSEGDAVIKVAVPQGCICYPDDREQWLCWQHYEGLRGNSIEHEILVDFRAPPKAGGIG